MPNKLTPDADPRQPIVYQIRVEGYLGCQWTEWFGGLTVRLEDRGITLITGPVIDQAALYSLLKKVRDLGMPLVSVNRVEDAPTDAPEVEPSSPVWGTWPESFENGENNEYR